MSADTSETLIARMMGTELGGKHFSEWSLKEKKAAIAACGLAHSNYKSTTACNEILHHLSTTRLPLSNEDVENALAERNINPARVKGTCKKLSLLLLQHMADGLSPPALTASYQQISSSSSSRHGEKIRSGSILANGVYRIS